MGDRLAMADGAAEGLKALDLEAKAAELGGVVEQHVGGEADLGSGDREHAALAWRRCAEAAHHVVDVVGGGDPLGEPTGFTVDRPLPEEAGVVAQLQDQLGIALSEGSLRQPAELIDVRVEGRIAPRQHGGPVRQGPEPAYAVRHLRAVHEAVHQIGYTAQLAAAAADRRQQAEVVQGAQQFSETDHRSGPTIWAVMAPVCAAVQGRAIVPVRSALSPTRIPPV